MRRGPGRSKAAPDRLVAQPSSVPCTPTVGADRAPRKGGRTAGKMVTSASTRVGLLGPGLAILAASTARPQGNPPSSPCPADPIAAMGALQIQIDALYANALVQAKAAQADLKAAVA